MGYLSRFKNGELLVESSESVHEVSSLYMLLGQQG